MNKIVRAMGLIALATIVVFTVVGCEELFGFLLSVDGKVVNVQAAKDSTEWWKSGKTSLTLEGATITLTNLKDAAKTYHGTVSNTGTYAIGSVAPGSYTISGNQTGWTFVPRRVDITGFLSTMPTMLAYETPADLEQILVMVEWSTITMDVDSYMARDLSGDGINNGTIVVGYNTGGGYFTDASSKVFLDRDITQDSPAAVPRVETIRVNGPAGTGFERLRYYIRLYNASTGTLTGDPTADQKASSGASVYVMQGSTHLGTFQIAIDSAEKVLGVVQMDWDNANSQWIIGSFGNPIYNNGDATGISGIKSMAGDPVEVDSIQ